MYIWLRNCAVEIRVGKGCTVVSYRCKLNEIIIIAVPCVCLRDGGGAAGFVVTRGTPCDDEKDGRPAPTKQQLTRIIYKIHFILI